MKEVILNAADGYELSLNIFEAKKPKATVQIIHGMEEYQDRYTDFAVFLSQNGFTVVTNDLRGHGKKCKDLGFFDEKNGYKKVIQDELDVKNYIKRTYKDIPIILFGHSMGSIIARLILQKSSKDYQKAILCGYPNYQGAASIGKSLCDFIQAFRGSHYKSNLVKNMAFGSFAKAIPDRKTDYDWLSYNDKNVETYINDSLCGYGFTVSAYRDLFEMVKLLKSGHLYHNVNEEMPILLISGDSDPCTGGEKGRAHSLTTLKEAGFVSIDVITYPHMRHEILNEDKKDVVFNDILTFLNK